MQRALAPSLESATLVVPPSPRTSQPTGPGVCAGRSSRDISEISTNSKSRLFFATLGGRTAAGLYGTLA